MPIGSAPALMFLLNKNAPWLDHPPKPYYRRHSAVTLRVSEPCRRYTRNII